jgi:hypothetical protein
MQRFNLKKLNGMEVNEQYQVKISNRFAALENVDDDWTLIWLGKVLECGSFSHRKSRLF